MERFKLAGYTEEVTAFHKTITFEYEDKEYIVDLFWDSHDGYELSFKGETPEWYWDWEETESVEYWLDCITEDEKVKA